MAKRAVHIPKFQEKQTLKSIRENSLNPVIDNLFAVETNIETVIAPKLDTAYENVTFDQSTSKLTFKKIGAGPSTEIDLSSIVPVFAGINIKGYTTHTSAGFPGGGEVKSTSNIKFEDAEISKDPVDSYAKVVYDWSKIVPEFQRNDTVTIEGSITTAKVYNKLEVIGEGGKTYFTHTDGGLKAGTVRINMPLIPEQQTAQVATSITSDTPFTKIKITGNVGGSTVHGDVLEIDLPSGGARTARYFEGFYNSVTDLDNITNPTEDRSSAYVKMEVTGTLYYVLHMYSGGAWKPVGTKPGLIYEGGLGGQNQGVISVKNSPDITVDDKGQMDLSKLQNPDPQARWFMGIYDSVTDLQAIPSPVEDKSYALLRNTSTRNGFLPYSYRNNTGSTNDPEWRLTPALGHLIHVKATAVGDDLPSEYTPIYGIKATGSTVDTKGVLLLPDPVQSTMRFITKGSPSSTPVSGDVVQVTFERNSNVKLDPNEKTATIYHPQQVVDADTSWKRTTRSRDYEGNIFYDKLTGKWIGMMDKQLGDKDEKWTYIAHRNMSDQVLSLNARCPVESKAAATAAATEKLWEVSGTTYLEKDDTGLPTEIKTVCGGFIKTEVKAVPVTVPPTKPDIKKQTRIQTCYADDGSGQIFMRAYDTAKTEWKTWTSVSTSAGAIAAHNADPKAHFGVFKYHKIISLQGKLSTIFSQTDGGVAGGLKPKNGSLLLDSHGHTQINQTYVTVPYQGNFRIGGVLDFSGYDENKKSYPAGKWQVLLRSKDALGVYTQIGQFIYDHTSEKLKYPNLSFEVINQSLKIDDQLITNITFTGGSPPSTATNALKTNHPNLYLVPVRSYFTVEDMTTIAGSRIADSYRSLFAPIDVYGNVGMKVHYTNIAESSGSIRTYGEAVDKNVTTMAKV